MRPWATIDDLTSLEARWVIMQSHIDKGLQYCDLCDDFGANTFCGKCGKRYVGRELTWRTCNNCKSEVSTDYCSMCSFHVAPQLLKDWEDGKVDIKKELEVAQGIMDKINKSLENSNVTNLADALNEGFGNG